MKQSQDDDKALRLLILQRQLIITLLIVSLVSLVFMIGFYFGDILRILGISVFMTYMGLTIVDLLQKYVKQRAVAVIVVYVALLAVVTVGLVLVVPAVVVQVSQLVQTTIDSLPQLLHNLTGALAPFVERLRTYQIEVKVVDILQKVVDNLPTPDASAIFSRVADVAVGTMTWVLYWISIAVVSFYFLLDGPRLTESVIGLFPLRHRPFISSIADDCDRSLQSFFRGQIILGLAFGGVMLVVYTVLGVQYALLLGIFLGVMEILPVIGPPIGFLPAVLAVAFHGSAIPGNRFVQILVLLGIFCLLQQAKDNVVAPKYIGNVIGLHPILICIAIMIGARLDGTLGIIFALPAACVVNVIVNRVRVLWMESHESITGTAAAAANRVEISSNRNVRSTVELTKIITPEGAVVKPNTDSPGS